MAPALSPMVFPCGKPWSLFDGFRISGRRYPAISSLFWLLALSCGSLRGSRATEIQDVASARNHGILAFDLLPVTNSSAIGLLAVNFGASPEPLQSVELLTTFYTNTDASLAVPAAALCTPGESEGSTLNWNVISLPWPGDVVRVKDASVGSSMNGIQLVKWEPNSPDQTLSIALRKGRGTEARNVTTIEKSILNNGEYSWNATQTFEDAGLNEGSDYSLMLWTETPPQRSISPYFTIRESTTGSTATKPLPSGLSKADQAKQDECLRFLTDHSGYYNQSADSSFSDVESFQTSYKNANTSWEIDNLGCGSTSISWTALNSVDLISENLFQLDDMEMDLLSNSTLGMGAVGLSALQAARNAPVVEQNIIALNLGSKGHPGSVVLGGYDQALIDNNNKAVFSKPAADPGLFQVTITSIAFVDARGKESTALNEDMGASAPIAVLAYDTYGIQLPQSALDSLLISLGPMIFDSTLNGYVSNAGNTPRNDYSLQFTLSNGTSSLTVTVPATSLLTTDPINDNPLTSRVESGKQYLQLSPVPDNGVAYLGRSFLQQVYLIDSPSTVNKFHLSALPSPFPTVKNLIPATTDTISIFGALGDNGSGNSSSSAPRVGPMVGGIVGGLALLGGGALLAFMIIRRKRQRDDLSIKDFAYPNSFEKDIGVQIGYRPDNGGGGGGGGNNGNNGGGTTSNEPDRSHSIRTTATIPIRYSPSFDKSYLPRASIPREVAVPPPSYVERPDDARALNNSRLSTLSATLSAKQRRISEVSTVARDIEYFTESSVMGSTEKSKQDILSIPNRATLGRIVSMDRIAKIESSAAAESSKGHARTASIGRRFTPTAVEVTSSRGSSTPKSRGSSSGESNHKQSLSIEEIPVPGPGGKKFTRRRTKSMATTATTSSAGDSEVFGLEAVTMDGEFVRNGDGKSAFLEDPEEEEDEGSLGSVLGLFPSRTVSPKDDART